MSAPDTGPTRGNKKRVRVPFQPRERNVTPREYEALRRAGYLEADLPSKKEDPAPLLQGSESKTTKSKTKEGA